ncbi:MAG: L-fucose:H+ symporter permease [Bacteroidales bacterium]|nr:L-fucose:H+ symporter permease [Bacteroidales bacterium]
MKEKQKIIEKKYLIVFILITSLFALWGFANDMTNPMVSAFKKILKELSNTEASLIQLAFYGGYATMAIPAALFIKKFSYKSGILVGLSLYAIGALLFYPAASYEAFGFFLAALYILTFGLAFLETTANPFVLSMGSPETATRRLNLAQSFNPIGSLSGMLVAQLYIISALKSDDYDSVAYNMLSSAEQAVVRANDLQIIRNPYVILGLFVIIMLAVLAFVKMPRKEDQNHDLNFKQTVKRFRSSKRYYEGVIAQVFYVGAQIMVWTFIFQYVDVLNESRAADQQLTATWYNMSAMILFLTGRAICTYLLKFINSGRLLMIFAILAIVATAGAIFLPGMAGLFSLVAISIFMSLMFPTIYGIALRDLGEDAKLASAGLVMAIVGGALMPPLQGRILDIGGDKFNDVLIMGVPEVNFSYILPMLCFVVVAVYGYRSFKYHLPEKS